MASRALVIGRDDDDDAKKLAEYNINPHVNICNTFWRPNLTFHPHHYGGILVAFESLWPNGEDLRVLVRDVFAQSALREAVIECAKLVLRCGPVRVLKELLRCRIIGLSQRFEPLGNTMLHLACIARNQEAVTYLLSQGISTKHTDKFGRTAEQVCFCSKTKRLLTVRSITPMKRPNTPASLQDKDTLFELITHSKSYDEIQIKLQSLDFDINKERNNDGDTLFHSAVRVGLSQLGLILSLVHIQCADIEEYTRYGMTPLCIAAEYGYSVIAEVLICCLGADPNNANPRNRWTPLHYAATENKLDVVNVLIKRGADVNLESIDHLRADDLARRHGNEDCEEAIVTKRIQRCELLSNRAENNNNNDQTVTLCRSLSSNSLRLTSLYVPTATHAMQHSPVEGSSDDIPACFEAKLKESDLRETDQFVVDSQDRTLVMVAAECNRIENLRILLSLPKCPVNAQHPQTLKTALSMAASNGNARAVQVLIQNKADPSIKDIFGYIPLHYACKENHKML
ncbi:putative ankyrin repeat protein RF_0381 isoform X2 [Ptychodera flava]|uniref:putative ankyrin repeat protein RF_0381 isoform X2 n=1 Tax=Ptychodera flava TaxID=63121 RepID=UPI00396A70B6